MNYEMQFSGKGLDKIATDFHKSNDELRSFRSELGKLRQDQARHQRIPGSQSYDGRDSRTEAITREAFRTSPIRRTDRDLISGVMDSVRMQSSADRYKESERAKAARLNTIAERQNDPNRAFADLLSTSRMGPGGHLYPLVSKLNQMGKLAPEELSDHLAKAGFSAAQAQSLAMRGGTSMAAASQIANLGFSAADAAKYAPMVAGLAEAALPVMLGSAVATAAIGGIVGIAEAGSASAGRLNNQFWVAGGSASSVAAAAAIGGDNAGQKALQLADALHQGGYGAAYLRSRGIYDAGPMFTPDRSKNYVDAVNAFRNYPGSREMRQRMASGTISPDDMWKTDLNNEQWKRLQNSIRPLTPSQRDADNEYNVNKAVIGNTWDNWMRTILPPLSAGLNTAMQNPFAAGLGTVMPNLSGGVIGAAQDAIGKGLSNYDFSDWRDPVGAFKRKMDAINGRTSPPMGSDASHGSGSGSGWGDQSPQQNDFRDLTNAVNDLGRAIKGDTTQGAGGRTGSAIPSGLGQTNFNNQIGTMAANFGAFGI